MNKDCALGCKHFHGGGVYHHKDCIYYPESLSEELDKLRAGEGHHKLLWKSVTDLLYSVDIKNKSLFNKTINGLKVLTDYGHKKQEELRVTCTMGSRGNAIGLDRDFLSYSTLQFGDEAIRTKGLLRKANPTTFLYETEDSHNLDIGSVLFSLGKRTDL